MENTIKSIEKAAKRLEDWNCLIGLSPNEKEQIIEDLKRIASTAIMDCQNATQNTILDLYNDFTVKVTIHPFKK